LRANQLRFLPSTTNIQLGKVGNMGGQVAHRDKALWFQNNRRDNSRLRLVTTEKWNMAHSQDQPCGHCGQASCRLVQTICRSDVEENRLVLALHPDVEAVDRHFAFGFLVGDERPAPVGWDQRQDGISGIGALIREIEARIDLPQHAPREDTEDNMWRLRLAVWPRYRSGLDRVEAEDAILVRRRTAEAHEPGVRPRAIVSW